MSTIYQLNDASLNGDSLRDAVIRFKELSLSQNNANRERSYPALVAKLRVPSAIAAFKDCFSRIHYRCVMRHGSLANYPDTINMRMILAAYMIRDFTSSVFEDNNGELEQRLLTSARGSSGASRASSPSSTTTMPWSGRTSRPPPPRSSAVSR